MSAALIVTRSEDLDAIGGWPHRRVRRISVSIDERAPAIDRLTAAINRDLRACGCVEGAAACAAAMALALLLGSALWPRLSIHTAALAGLLFAYLLTAALVGKIAGVVLAQRRLTRNIRELRRSLAAGGSARE